MLIDKSVLMIRLTEPAIMTSAMEMLRDSGSRHEMMIKSVRIIICSAQNILSFHP